MNPGGAGRPPTDRTDMIRATALAIVVALTLGQNASLPCAIWCYPALAGTSSCAHEVPLTSPAIGEDDDCPEVVAVPAAFVRDDGRRAVSDHHEPQAVAGSPFSHGTLPTQTTWRGARARLLPFEAQPLVLVLRI